jgi:hypothetical protein
MKATKQVLPTPFEVAYKQVMEGLLKAPSVNYQGQGIPYFRYQLSVHKFNLSIMSSGMTCRGVKLKDLKNYYGLTGKSAKECLEQFEVILDNYKKEQIKLN